MLVHFSQLLLAVVLGALLGLERELAGKTAGIRTHALVALGAVLFSIMSKLAFEDYVGVASFDPSRLASQVIVGVGFIGAGAIIFNRSHVQGLTTAAGLWVAAAIGMAVAYKFYAMAIFATILTIIIFIILWHLEDFLTKKLPLKRRKNVQDNR